MSSEPSVSIVIPCYNGEAYLSDAIKSTQSQHPPPLEIIVIDDGSTDNSKDIAENLGVKVIKQDNQGVSAARNTGLYSISGEYVIFLDADDKLAPQAIATHTQSLNASQHYLLSFGSNIVIDSNGNKLEENIIIDRAYNRADAALGVNPSPSQCMYRTKPLLKLSGFNTELSHSEDTELLLRLLENGQAVSTGKIVAEYRRHDAQVTKKPSRGLVGSLKVLEIAQERKAEDIDWDGLRCSTKEYYGQFIPIEISRNLIKRDLNGAIKCLNIYSRNLPYTLLGSLKFMRKKLSPGK
jgi:glycosyltransferase involved in cell wall biosynthesis